MSITVVKQGIVSVLGSEECDQITKAVTLRRTLSADMSSKHWLAQNGYSFSPMKRIASSEGLSNKINESFSSSYEEVQKPSQDDIWGLIKENEEKSTLPPPYVHPLVRRSTSSLSEKSLDICTESLGSETGSDHVFLSDKDETRVTQSKPTQEKEWQTFDIEEPLFTNSSFSSTKKYSPPKPFPPPLSSLAQRDGPTLHMQPHREDGRLVLEAVSFPSVICFHSHRQDGRLFLTFSGSSPAKELNLEKAVNQEEVYDLDEEIFNNHEVEKNGYLTETEEESDDDGGEENEIRHGANELGIFMDQTPNNPSRLINVHRSALVMKKLRGLNNKDPKWTEKLMKQVNLEMTFETNVIPASLVSQSLPQPPGMACLMSSSSVIAATASLNPYKYCWETKHAIGTVINPIAQQNSPLKNNHHNAFSPSAIQNQENALLRGNNGDYSVPIVRGCKENRKRSLLFREPYCIATS